LDIELGNGHDHAARRKKTPVRTRTGKEAYYEISCSPGFRPARENNDTDEPRRPTWTACANAIT
jgi:hypothetical protein